jgi:CelD/BcsL family acetyltransferase involved in cellulose biosynthesis
MSTLVSDAGFSTPEPTHAREPQDVVERTAFAALRSEWNDLVETTRPQPFYRHEYIASFLRHFLPQAPIRIVTCRDGRGSLVSVLPLVRTRGSICGIPTRDLGSPCNVHSLRFDLIDQTSSKGDALLDHLARDESWDVLRFTDVPEGGLAFGLHRAALAAGFPTGVWESQRSPYIALPRTIEILMNGLRTKFKANLRRRRRKLAEQGEVRVERLEGDDLQPHLLQECFALERSGWKGRRGSAVTQSEASLGFHLELLADKEYRQNLSLFRLTVGGQLVAFHYGHTSHGVYSLVMTSYDERYKDTSPGHLLTEDVLNDCVTRGLVEFDFLGCDLPWKLEWTKSVRPHYWIFIFRKNAFGRLLWRIKFVWVKAARRLLTKMDPRASAGRAPLAATE